MKNLALTLCLFMFFVSPVWAGYMISGKIIAESGQDTEGINVVLIEQNPNKPPQGPLTMAKVQAGGAYSLEIDEVDPSSNYVVGTRLGQVRTSSKPFKISQPTTSIDVHVPAGGSSMSVPAGEVIKGPFVFKGQLKGRSGFEVAGAQVQLIEVTLKKPDGRVVSTVRAGQNGVYQIRIPRAAKHSLYFLAASKEAHIAGSDPVPLRAEKRILTVNMTFLPVSQDGTQLSVEKNLYFFELMKDVVSVSEILLVQNQFHGTLDLRAKPFSKRLPQGAINFHLMRSSENIQVEKVNDKLLLSLALNPGRSQVFYTYDLPKSSFGKDMQVDLLPQTKEVELVRTSKGFQIDFLGAMANNVVESKKVHGQEVFYSKRALVLDQATHFGFNVDVSLIPQKRLFYPATLLLVLLLSGLFWYVKIKPEQK